MRRIATLAGIVFASCGLMFMPAYAAPPSSQSVADSCPPKFLDLTTDSLLDEAAVTQSSSQLSRAIDGDVYVLGFEKEPGGNIETYLDNLYATCSDMHSADGSLRGNLMVFAFALTPETAAIVDIGEDYYDEVTENEQNHINDDVLWEGVHNADPTTAVVNAQKAMELALTQDESAGVPQSNTDPWDGADAGPFLKWAGIVLGVLIALVVGWIGIVSAIRRRGEAKQTLVDARVKAKEVAEEASNLSQGLSFDDTELLLAELRLKAVGFELTDLEALYNEAHARYGEATTADANWNDVSLELDPEKELSLEQYQQVISMNSNTVQLVNSATEAIGVFDKAGKALLAIITNPMEALQNLRQWEASLQARISDSEMEPMTATLEQVASVLAQAEQLIGSGKNVETVKQLNTATALLVDVEARYTQFIDERDEQQRAEEAAEQQRILEEERARYQPPPVIEAAPRPRRRSNPSNSGFQIPRPRINWPAGGGGFGGGGGRSSRPKPPSQPKSSAPRRSFIQRSGGGMRRSSRRGR